MKDSEVEYYKVRYEEELEHNKKFYKALVKIAWMSAQCGEDAMHMRDAAWEALGIPDNTMRVATMTAMVNGRNNS